MSLDLLPPWQEPAVIQHSQLLCASFRHWSGESLVSPELSALDQAQALFRTKFAVLSHGLEADPILNYGNQVALDLWQLDWQQFTQMPSRFTAEPLERQERDRLLQQAADQGYITGYRGIRIANNGQRFEIANAQIWDLLSADGQKRGQAARFDRWQFLGESV
jgi:MEKHLA domain